MQMLRSYWWTQYVDESCSNWWTQYVDESCSDSWAPHWHSGAVLHRHRFFFMGTLFTQWSRLSQAVMALVGTTCIRQQFQGISFAVEQLLPNNGVCGHNNLKLAATPEHLIDKVEQCYKDTPVFGSPQGSRHINPLRCKPTTVQTHYGATSNDS
eukprot:scaffold163448_cov24-Tisochrysis_lutea.AAC.1